MFSPQLPEKLERNMFWINMLGYSHAMVNPVIYITLNEKFRQEFCNTWHKTTSRSDSMLQKQMKN